MPDKLKKLFGWLDFGGSMFGNVANVISTALTNKSNQRIAAAQNAMQMAESEKAYQRSKATNQVNLMRDAGMSKAGALNALNGGGSYQPAPITSTPNQAPQMDLSSAFDGLIQIGENAKQRKMQEDMLDKQLKYNAEQAEKQRDHELLLSDIQSGNQVQHDYLEYEKHRESLDFQKLVYQQAAPLRQKQLEELDARISGLKATTTHTKIQNEILELQKELQSDSLNYEKLRIKSEALTTAAQGELDRLMIAQKRGALLEMDAEELRSFMQYKMRLELASMISDAIKEEQWNKGKLEGKLKILKFIDDFLVGVKK